MFIYNETRLTQENFLLKIMTVIILLFWERDRRDNGREAW